MNWKFWKLKKKKQKEDYSNIRRGNVNDFRNNKTGEITESALEYGKQGRYLKLKDNDCALVIHDQNKIEVIFTKLYDAEKQQFTSEEQTLMSIAIFLKQPGFSDLIRHEFNKIATRSISQLTSEKEEDK